MRPGFEKAPAQQRRMFRPKMSGHGCRLYGSVSITDPAGNWPLIFLCCRVLSVYSCILRPQKYPHARALQKRAVWGSTDSSRITLGFRTTTARTASKKSINKTEIFPRSLFHRPAIWGRTSFRKKRPCDHTSDSRDFYPVLWPQERRLKTRRC